MSSELAPGLGTALDAVEAATRHLQAVNDEDRAAGATPYLRLFAGTVGGFLLARGAAVASEEEGREWPGLARFYVRHLLPPLAGLLPVIQAGAGDLRPELLES
jgi:hypothetical protein